MTTLDFVLRMFAGESGNLLVGSLIVSTVRGLEFNIPSVSNIIVSKDSSSKALHEFVTVKTKSFELSIFVFPRHHPCGLQQVGFAST